MREVIVIIKCDLCGNATDEDDSGVLPWSWMKTDYEAELCGKCMDTADTKPVAELLDASTRVGGRKRKTYKRAPSDPTKGVAAPFANAEGTFDCPEPGCKSKPKKNAAGLGVHVSRAHNRKLEDYHR